jgi:hypothetical protein
MTYPSDTDFKAEYRSVDLTLSWLHQTSGVDNNQYWESLCEAAEIHLRGHVRRKRLFSLYARASEDLSDPYLLRSEANYLLQLALEGLQRQLLRQDIPKIKYQGPLNIAVNMPWIRVIAVEGQDGKVERINSPEQDGCVTIGDKIVRFFRNDTEEQRRSRLFGRFQREILGRVTELSEKIKNTADVAVEDVLPPVQPTANRGPDVNELKLYLDSEDSRALWSGGGGTAAERQRYSRALKRARLVFALLRTPGKDANDLLAQLKTQNDGNRQTLLRRWFNQNAPSKSAIGTP